MRCHGCLLLHAIHLDQALIRLKLAAQNRPVEALAASLPDINDIVNNNVSKEYIP
jgi:hypothetical protein